MKHIRLMFAVLVTALAFSSCGKDNPGGGDGGWTGEGSVTGTWHLAGWNSLQTADVYLSLENDGTFDLYQRIYSPYYEHYDGTWHLDGNTLGGTYSDGTAWAGTYSVSFSGDGDRMQLVLNGDSSDTSVFTRSEIPDEITSGDFGTRTSAGMAGGKRFL